MSSVSMPLCIFCIIAIWYSVLYVHVTIDLVGQFFPNIIDTIELEALVIRISYIVSVLLAVLGVLKVKKLHKELQQYEQRERNFSWLLVEMMRVTSQGTEQEDTGGDGTISSEQVLDVQTLSLRDEMLKQFKVTFDATFNIFTLPQAIVAFN